MFYIMLILLFYWSVFFFFKQKTAYEMRISDWSSDVCSSDLVQISNWRRAMTRVVSLFLPSWSTDRLRRKAGDAAHPAEAPLVLIGRDGNRRVVLAADAAAQGADRKSTRLNSSH